LQEDAGEGETKGNEGKDGAEISPNAVVCFGLLLEAAFLPLLIKARLRSLPTVERDEGLDALHERALKWRWLMLGWATETGRAGSLSTSGSGAMVTLDQTEFLESLAEVATFVDLEWSAPLQQRSASGAVSVPDEDSVGGHERRRVALTGRTRWQGIALAAADVPDFEPEEVESAFAEVDVEALPIFGEPSRVLPDGQRVGEVWVRISPESLSRLENDLVTTFETLALIEERRLSDLRELLHEQDETVDPERLAGINRDFSAREMAIRALRTVVTRLKKEKSGRRRRALERRALIDLRQTEAEASSAIENSRWTVRSGVAAVKDKTFGAEIAVRIRPADGSKPDYGAALDLIDRYRSTVTAPHAKPLDDLYRYLRRRTLDRGVADWLRAWSGSGLVFILLAAVLLLLLFVTDIRELVRAAVHVLTG
jgi:hypothetical protein